MQFTLHVYMSYYILIVVIITAMVLMMMMMMMMMMVVIIIIITIIIIIIIFNYFLFNICTGSNCPGNKTLHNFSLDERVIGS